MLFASYHYLVRPTFIGQLLNGRKYPRKPLPPGSTPSPASPPPADTVNGGPVAQLRGITKKFGAVTALNAIDIEVRRGELLAVLGPNGAGKSTAISLWLGLIEAGCRRGHAARRRAAGHRHAPRARRDDAGRGSAQGAARYASSCGSPPATTTIR